MEARRRLFAQDQRINTVYNWCLKRQILLHTMLVLIPSIGNTQLYYSQLCVLSLPLEFKSCISNFLLDIPIWVFNRQWKANLYKVKVLDCNLFLFPSSLAQLLKPDRPFPIHPVHVGLEPMDFSPFLLLPSLPVAPSPPCIYCSLFSPHCSRHKILFIPLQWSRISLRTKGKFSTMKPCKACRLFPSQVSPHFSLAWSSVPGEP